MFSHPHDRRLPSCCQTNNVHPPIHPPAEEALADPYFASLHSPAREPSAHAVSKTAFEFERRKLAMDEVRELIYREILEYHPQVRGLSFLGERREVLRAGRFSGRWSKWHGMAVSSR
jgi:hypothetical protein